VDPCSRGKKAIAINCKEPQGQDVIRRMCNKADVLIDPFRPGVLEKLNLNPVDLMKENQKLIVARLTGYGQNGPMSQVAGHDMNYLSLSGLLSLFVSSADHPKPVPPINILG
jgi:alpha-methylacyl-CoA racemase